MTRLTMAFLFFLYFLIFKGVWCSGQRSIRQLIVNNQACNYGMMLLNVSAGTIVSPLSTDLHPMEVSCSWVILNPDNNFITFSFSQFELDSQGICTNNDYSCCQYQYISIKSSSSHQEEESTPISEETRVLGNFVPTQKHRRMKRHVPLDVNGLQEFLQQPYILNSKKQSSMQKSLFADLLSSRYFSPLHSQTFKSPDRTAFRLASKNKKFFCGTLRPKPFVTSDSEVVIKFFSDKLARLDLAGFRMEFYKSGEDDDTCESSCKDPKYCIPPEWKCSGQKECLDGSDEDDCLGCEGLEKSKHCDGHWDCPMGEDEIGCSGCTSERLSCGEYIGCSKKQSVCRGISECFEYSEKSYVIYCGANYTQCLHDEGFCYNELTDRCNGIFNCPSGEDELGCVDSCYGMLPCSSGGGCYNQLHRCDGIIHCMDMSDESCCTPNICHPLRGGFLCSNHRCIKDQFQCDEIDDCGDGSDEIDCLRNSVLVAASMGVLVCALLLVIAVSCSCRLYALKVASGSSRDGNGALFRINDRSDPSIAPLTRLERHLLQRELPPSYQAAINDPSTLLCSSRPGRRWSRGAACSFIPPESGGQSSLGVPSSPRSYSLLNSASSSNSAAEGREMLLAKPDGNHTKDPSEEHQLMQSGSYDDEDVPLLSASVGDVSRDAIEDDVLPISLEGLENIIIPISSTPDLTPDPFPAMHAAMSGSQVNEDPLQESEGVSLHPAQKPILEIDGVLPAV